MFPCSADATFSSPCGRFIALALSFGGWKQTALGRRLKGGFQKAPQSMFLWALRAELGL